MTVRLASDKVPLLWDAVHFKETAPLGLSLSLMQIKVGECARVLSLAEYENVFSVSLKRS